MMWGMKILLMNTNNDQEGRRDDSEKNRRQ